MQDVIVLYSGGADSRLMIELALMAKKRPYAVLVDYGQKHVDELKFAEKHLCELSVPYQIVRIDGLPLDSGLTGNLQKSRWENVNPMNVPARNTILLSIAMAIAENMGTKEVWYGADYSDREDLFPDCYQEYVIAMNEVCKLGLATKVKIVAPLLGMPKQLILDILEHHFNITKDDMYSGYKHPQERRDYETC